MWICGVGQEVVQCKIETSEGHARGDKLQSCFASSLKEMWLSVMCSSRTAERSDKSACDMKAPCVWLLLVYGKGAGLEVFTRNIAKAEPRRSQTKNTAASHSEYFKAKFHGHDFFFTPTTGVQTT